MRQMRVRHQMEARSFVIGHCSFFIQNYRGTVRHFENSGKRKMINGLSHQ